MARVSINEVVQAIKDLNENDFNNLLSAMENLKAIKRMQDQEPDSIVTDEIPCFFLPTEYMLPALEWLFMLFLKEMANNFDDDYTEKIFNILTNNNDLTIQTYFDKTMANKGQYPRAIVKCEEMGFNSEYIGDIGPVNENAQGQYVMRIDIIGQEYVETNILASIVAASLAANRDILRQMFSLQQISYPRMIGAQKVREYDMLFMSTISFTCLKQLNWNTVDTSKKYLNYYFSIVATAYGASKDLVPNDFKDGIAVGTDGKPICPPILAAVISASSGLDKETLERIIARRS